MVQYAWSPGRMVGKRALKAAISVGDNFIGWFGIHGPATTNKLLWDYHDRRLRAVKISTYLNVITTLHPQFFFSFHIRTCPNVLSSVFT